MSLSSFAQGYFSLGARVGTDFSNLTNFSSIKSSLEDLKATDIKHPTKVGFMGGFVAAYNFTKRAALQMELLIEQKGERYTFTTSQLPLKSTASTTYNNSLNLTLTYLTIPILFKGSAKFRHGESPVGFFAEVGPFIGIGISAKEKYEIYGKSGSETIKFGKPEDEYDTKLSRVDFGFIASFGPTFRLGPGDLILDFRWAFGILDVNNPYSKGDNYEKRCNNSYCVNIGYLFNLGGE